MKNILALLFCTILFYQAPLTSANSTNANNIKCTPYMQKSLKAIHKVPEGNALIAKILEDGPIKIMIKNTDLSNEFGAYWDPDERTICICYHSGRTEGTMLYSLLFELHNAAKNAEFHRLDCLAADRAMSKSKYVESVEYIEYENSLSAHKIAGTGIALGLFPSDAQQPVYHSFQKHFSIQQQYGHSACIARNYDALRNWKR